MCSQNDKCPYDHKPVYPCKEMLEVINFREQPDRCPRCESREVIMMDDTLPGHGEPDSTRDYTCGNCDFEWYETYTFSEWGTSDPLFNVSTDK